jgi:hypothetical protein
MKTTIFKNKIVNTMVFAATCGIALDVVAPKTGLVHASDNPKVIEISAKKFEFTPSAITLKEGEPETGSGERRRTDHHALLSYDNQAAWCRDAFGHRRQSRSRSAS